MAKEILDVIVKLGYEGKQNAKDAKRDIEGVGKASGGLALDFEAMAAAAAFSTTALSILAGVAVFTYKEMRKGDAVEKTARDFENLTAGIGTTSDGLLRLLRPQFAGTISDMELMQKANGLMIEDVVKTPEELARVMGIMIGLQLSEADTIAIFKDGAEVAEAKMQEYEARMLTLGVASAYAEDSLGRVDAMNANIKDSFALGVKLGLEPFLKSTDKMIVALGGPSGLNAQVEALGTLFSSSLLPPIMAYPKLAEEGGAASDALGLLLSGQIGIVDALFLRWVALNGEIEKFNGGSTPGAKGGKGDAPYYPPNPGGGDYDFATGTPAHPGGWSNLGEYGPERMYVPAGSRVTSTNVTHNQTQNMNLTNSRSVERIVSSYFRNRARGRRIL